MTTTLASASTPTPFTTRPRPPGPRQRSRGFTLIELMIAVTVIGILSAIAAPSFMDPVRKARRLDAVVALFEIQQAQERWRAQYPCYAARLAATATAEGAPPAAHFRLPAADRRPLNFALTTSAM